MSLPKNTFKYNTKVWKVFEFLRMYNEITADRMVNQFGEFQYNRCIKDIRDKIKGTGWWVENTAVGRFALKEIETKEGQKKLF